MPPRSLRLTESASEEVEEQHGDVGEIASAMATLFISLPALGMLSVLVDFCSWFCNVSQLTKSFIPCHSSR